MVRNNQVDIADLHTSLFQFWRGQFSTAPHSSGTVHTVSPWTRIFPPCAVSQLCSVVLGSVDYNGSTVAIVVAAVFGEHMVLG